MYISTAHALKKNKNMVATDACSKESTHFDSIFTGRIVVGDNTFHLELSGCDCIALISLFC